MNLFAADRVKVFCTTQGTGSFGLGNAYTPAFNDFTTAGIPDAKVIDYSAFTTSQFETGRGTYSSGGSSLSRDTIFQSSNSDLLVNFTATPVLIIAWLAETFLPSGQVAISTRRQTAAGDVTVVSGDNLIVIDKAVGELTAVNLPLASTWYPSIVVKDGKGDAPFNNIIILPSGSDLIDKQTSYTLTFPFQSVTLNPYASGWYVT